MRRLLAAILLSACASPDGSPNQPPVALAGRDLRVVLQDELVHVELDGLASYDPEGEQIAWQWRKVAGPAEAFFAGDGARTPRPVVGLPAPGLYVFELVVRDRESASTPDYANVWVSPGALPPVEAPDAGARDAAPPPEEDAEVPDAAPDATPVEIPDGAVVDFDPDDAGDEGDAAQPEDGSADLPVPDAAEPDAAAPPPDAGPGPNRSPVAVIDVAETRVEVAQPIRLSGARSRDDGQPGPLTHHWRLVSGPFAVRVPQLDSDGVAVEYTPRVGGRYTFELAVSDGELVATARQVVHVRGPVGYVVYPEQGVVLQRNLATAEGYGDPIELGDLSGLTAMAVRGGILYATLRSPASSSLLIAAPGEPVLRRALPEGGSGTAPVAGFDRVWVPLLGVAEVVGFDPLGRAPLVSLPLPARVRNAFRMEVYGSTGWLTSIDQPPEVLTLDLAARRAVGVAFTGDELCSSPHSLARDEEYVYVSCRQRNAVGRIGHDADRGRAGLDERQVVALPGGAGARALKLVVTNDHVVVCHQDTDFVSAVAKTVWNGRLDDPRRDRDPGAVVRLGAQVEDIASLGRLFYALTVEADGSGWIVAHDPRTGERRWAQRSLRLRPRLIVVDAFDDFTRDFSELQ